MGKYCIGFVDFPEAGFRKHIERIFVRVKFMREPPESFLNFLGSGLRPQF